MANNLIVDEEYINEEAVNIKNNFFKMNSIISLYLRCLNEMSNEAIMEGATADALKAYIEYAQQLKDDLNKIGKNTSLLLENYLLAVDDADKYLF